MIKGCLLYTSGTPVRVLVLSRAVIGFPGNVLHRGVGVEAVLVVLGRERVVQSPAVDVVIGLLCHVRLVRGTMEIISAPAEFLDVVVFHRDFAEMRGFIVGAETERGAVDD